MKKLRTLKHWEAAVCLLLIPTVLLMVVLLFFVPPVLDQYDWVRLEDRDKAVEYLHLMIEDKKLGLAEYSVKRADGTLERVQSNAETEIFSTKDDSTGRESNSLLTLAQAQILLKPLWDFVTSAGDWDVVDVSLLTPRSVSMVVSKIKVDATLSVSTGKLAMVAPTTVKETDLGILSVSAVDQDLTHSFQAWVLLIP